MEPDEKFMREALAEARAAAAEEEIPIGAVIVCKGRIIGKGHNMVERLHDATAHAEMIAITAATEALGGKCKEKKEYVWYIRNNTVNLQGKYEDL